MVESDTNCQSRSRGLGEEEKNSKGLGEEQMNY
jgi:hypothetical protein